MKVSTKKEILAQFNKAVLECEWQFRSLLSSVGDYENVVKDAVEEKELNPKELDWVLDSVKRKSIAFSECIKRVDKELWKKLEPVLKENLEKFGHE